MICYNKVSLGATLMLSPVQSFWLRKKDVSWHLCVNDRKLNEMSVPNKILIVEELWYNTTFHGSIGITLFGVVYGKKYPFVDTIFA